VEILVMDPLSASAEHPVRWKLTDIHKRSGKVTTWMHKMPLMI
jgi:hypothetical protein